MKSIGGGKLILVGLGAMLAYSHFGPMGLVIAGVILFLL